jgi:hypothetical protein
MNAPLVSSAEHTVVPSLRFFNVPPMMCEQKSFLSASDQSLRYLHKVPAGPTTARSLSSTKKTNKPSQHARRVSFLCSNRHPRWIEERRRREESSTRAVVRKWSFSSHTLELDDVVPPFNRVSASLGVNSS